MKNLVLFGGCKEYHGMFNDINTSKEIDEAALIGGDTDITSAYGIPTMAGMIVFIGSDTGSHGARVKVKLKSKDKGKHVKNLPLDKFYTAYPDNNGKTVHFKGGSKSGISPEQKIEIEEFVKRNFDVLIDHKYNGMSDDDFTNSVLETERAYYESLNNKKKGTK